MSRSRGIILEPLEPGRLDPPRSGFYRAHCVGGPEPEIWAKGIPNTARAAQKHLDALPESPALSHREFWEGVKILAEQELGKVVPLQSE